MRILLVEDDVPVAQSLLGLLELSGVQVIHKSNAASAIAALQEADFGLIISDYSLGPGENGDAVLKAAQALRPQARRVMISGSDSASWVVEVGLAHAFFLKNSGLADILFNEAESLSRPAPAL